MASGAVRAAAIGGAVGLLAWLAPSMAGGGDSITQRMLSDTGALSGIVLVFAVRFVLGPLSYAAATPGGLFAPMLVLGAQMGVVFGRRVSTGFRAPRIRAVLPWSRWRHSSRPSCARR